LHIKYFKNFNFFHKLNPIKIKFHFLFYQIDYNHTQKTCTRAVLRLDRLIICVFMIGQTKRNWSAHVTSQTIQYMWSDLSKNAVLLRILLSRFLLFSLRTFLWLNFRLLDGAGVDLTCVNWINLWQGRKVFYFFYISPILMTFFN